MTAIGIDLGTTNSCMAIRLPAGVRVVENREGHPTTPSVVAQEQTGKWVAGKYAARFAEKNPAFTFSATKRLIGRQVDEPIVREMARRSSFAIVGADNGAAWVQGRNARHAPEEISARVLEKLREDAEFALGAPVTKAVITVPAYFNNAQRQATIAAGKIAGLEVLQILPEPTAAAIAYGVEMAAENATIAVYDLGGGTFDISILRVQAGEYETLATSGDPFLGGVDFDAALSDWVVQRQTWVGASTLMDDAMYRLRIMEEAELARKDLSNAEQRVFNVPYIKRVGGRPMHLREVVLREDLESITAGLIERTREPCRKALEAAGVDTVDTLVLVGGMTKMPAVARMAASLFPGARVVATDPDKIVAIGAALLASSLDGGQQVKLSDVTPHAVSVETADGLLVELIPAQSKVPAARTVKVATMEPNQAAVTARLVQGDDLVLGQFHLEVAKGPALAPRVELAVNLDASGTVHAQMREIATGRIAAAPMALVGGMDERAIARLAKAHRKDPVLDTTTLPPPPEPDTPAEPDDPRTVAFDEAGALLGVDEDDQPIVQQRVADGATLEEALAELGYRLETKEPA